MSSTAFSSLFLRKGKANKLTAALQSYLGFWQLKQTKTYQFSHHFSSMRKVSHSYTEPTVQKHPLATSGVCKTKSYQSLKTSASTSLLFTTFNRPPTLETTQNTYRFLKTFHQNCTLLHFSLNSSGKEQHTPAALNIAINTWKFLNRSCSLILLLLCLEAYKKCSVQK